MDENMNNNIENEQEALQTPEEKPAEKNFSNQANEAAQKAKDFVKNLQLKDKAKDLIAKAKALPKTIWYIAGGAVAAVVALIILISIFTNTYKTPINLAEDIANAKRYSSPFDQAVKMLNGFGEKEMKAIVKIMAKAESYEDMLEDAKDNFEDEIEDKKDEYGKNYKFSFKIEDKEKLDKDDLKDLRDNLRDLADDLKEVVEKAEDFDSDDWEDFADDLEVSKSDAKKLIGALEDLQKLCKSAKVTAGYELEVVQKITGSELDEPEEDDSTVYVYKVNGRWVSQDALSFLRMFGAISF